ncbi:MAG TPA: MATE family efflux transporter [Burkholderiaceae bacterium]|nr:MATE family efflux transporter [Burkholderiaceae bacterium]
MTVTDKAAASGRGAAQTRPLWRVFLAFLGPMVLANVLQSLSGTFNAVFIGQMLGTHALAAVSAVFPIVFFLISLVIGIGAGASVLIGQAWGARERHKVKTIAGTALSLGLLLGLAVGVLGGVFTEAMLRWLGTPAEVYDDAVGYARVMMFAMPGLLSFILSTQLLRGVGDTITPLYALIVSTGVSAVLTPSFIRGWGGLPHLGVTSAAAASIGAFVAALLFMGWIMRRKAHPLAPDGELLRALRIDPHILKLVARIGLPTGVQVIVMSLAEIALLALINSYGADATAAAGAVNQVVNYVQFPALSIAITASILGAQAIGAGRTHRLGAITKTALMINLIITGSLVLIGYLFSRHLISAFITNADVIELAQRLLHIMLWGAIVYGFAAALSGVMRASGVVLMPTTISIACIVLVEVPAAYGLSHVFGLDGVWMSYPIAFSAMLVLQTAYYRLVWRKIQIERLV